MRATTCGARTPVAESIPRELQKDLEIVKVRLIECREPRELDVWLHRTRAGREGAQSVPSSDDIAPVWTRIMGSACYAELTEFQRRWLALFQAVGARNARRMAELAAARRLRAAAPGGCARVPPPGGAGRIGRERRQGESMELWKKYGQGTRARTPFRLLRCHADPATCAEAFAAYAER